MSEPARLSLTDLTAGVPVELRPQRLIIGGYTARDEAAARKHIEELAAIGIDPPPAVPMFYELDPALLTTDERVLVDSDATSGEVEPVLIRISNQMYLGVGSDHTDRNLERQSVAASKGSCPKPLCNAVLRLPATVDAWDAVRIRSTVDGLAYQEGSLGELREPADLLKRLRDTSGDDGADLVIFAGTVPLLDGAFRYGQEWSLELELPGGLSLKHSYTVDQRSGR